MALDLSDCQFFGPALPVPFVRFELEKEFTSRKSAAEKARERRGEASSSLGSLAADTFRSLPRVGVPYECGTRSSSP